MRERPPNPRDKKVQTLRLRHPPRRSLDRKNSHLVTSYKTMRGPSHLCALAAVWVPKRVPPEQLFPVVQSRLQQLEGPYLRIPAPTGPQVGFLFLPPPHNSLAPPVGGALGMGSQAGAAGLMNLPSRRSPGAQRGRLNDGFQPQQW